MEIRQTFVSVKILWFYFNYNEVDPGLKLH